MKLREARNKRKLTQDRLSELSGVPQGVISRIERGLVKNPEFRQIKLLCGVLRVRLDEVEIGE